MRSLDPNFLLHSSTTSWKVSNCSAPSPIIRYCWTSSRTINTSGNFPGTVLFMAKISLSISTMAAFVIWKSVPNCRRRSSLTCSTVIPRKSGFSSMRASVNFGETKGRTISLSRPCSRSLSHMASRIPSSASQR